MNNKEKIQYRLELTDILNETNNLLIDDEIETLQEGVIGTIFKGILIAPFALAAGLITFGLIWNKIADIKHKHKINKESKKLTKEEKMTLMSESRAIIENYHKLIKLVKFAKYNPIVISMMNDYVEFSNKFDKRLETIDKEFQAIKTIDEFNKKADLFQKRYDKYNKEIKAEFEALNKKYSNPKEEWKSGIDVLSILTKYIEYFKTWDNHYYKNTDYDDYWECITFLYDLYRDNKGSASTEITSIYNRAYDIYITVSDTASDFILTGSNKCFENPFKYIKLQFSGETEAE